MRRTAFPRGKLLCACVLVLKMAAKYFVVAALCVAVGAAPPSPPLYRQLAQRQQQQLQAYDYYLENQEIPNYYSQPQQKQAASNHPSGAPSRLESLEPDSEVELIPGAQQPQQPPQQNPVSPNLPGLVPGQRVFIVHMPVPGYRPGSIGGYQPVYIVAAAPQGNAGYQPNVPNGINGYQNAVLLDPSGQSVYSPLLGFPHRGIQQPLNPGYLLAPQLQNVRGPYELAYQEPAYQAQQAQAQGPQQAGPGGPGGLHPVQLSQLIALQTHANVANSPRSSANESTNAESKRLAQSRESNETKEAEEQRRNARPTSAHVQSLKA